MKFVLLLFLCVAMLLGIPYILNAHGDVDDGHEAEISMVDAVYERIALVAQVYARPTAFVLTGFLTGLLLGRHYKHS